jgi:hypothetical protein
MIQNYKVGRLVELSCRYFLADTFLQISVAPVSQRGNSERGKQFYTCPPQRKPQTSDVANKYSFSLNEGAT